jgi:hypothetical protein
MTGRVHLLYSAYPRAPSELGTLELEVETGWPTGPVDFTITTGTSIYVYAPGGRIDAGTFSSFAVGQHVAAHGSGPILLSDPAQAFSPYIEILGN